MNLDESNMVYVDGGSLASSFSGQAWMRAFITLETLDSRAATLCNPSNCQTAHSLRLSWLSSLSWLQPSSRCKPLQAVGHGGMAWGCPWSSACSLILLDHGPAQKQPHLSALFCRMATLITPEGIQRIQGLEKDRFREIQQEFGYLWLSHFNKLVFSV